MPKVIPQASKSSAKGKGQPLSSKSKNQADKIVKAKKPLILFKKEEKMGLYILKVQSRFIQLWVSQSQA